MDWTTPLRSQQVDFIQRLKSGLLLHCQIAGQHSELTVISGERLRQLRDFCWEMAEKYKRMSPVRDVFINNRTYATVTCDRNPQRARGYRTALGVQVVRVGAGVGVT